MIDVTSHASFREGHTLLLTESQQAALHSFSRAFMTCKFPLQYWPFELITFVFPVCCAGSANADLLSTLGTNSMIFADGKILFWYEEFK